MDLKRRNSLLVLDFDIENRPLSYLGFDYTTAEVTAIAASFSPNDPVMVWLLGRDHPVTMLEVFRHMYNQADIVTGHYIRKHDLPIINGAMLEYGLEPLAPKMTSDTKLDLMRFSGLSKSQENLSAMFGTESPKIGVNQHQWRQANRLHDLSISEERCVADVRQHQELRQRLIEAQALAPPKMWAPFPQGLQ